MLTGLALAMALGADATIALGTGPKMCAALTAADFTAVGLSPDTTPPAPAELGREDGRLLHVHQCVSPSRGLEFDIFDGESDPSGRSRRSWARVAASQSAPISQGSMRPSWRSRQATRG